MASKYEKEEKFCYDSNTDSDGETNNSKSRSGSSSPTPQFEERIVNQTGRSGGPCAPEVCLGECGHNDGRNKHVIYFTCGDSKKVCNWCDQNAYKRCPNHRQSARKQSYLY